MARYADRAPIAIGAVVVLMAAALVVAVVILVSGEPVQRDAADVPSVLHRSEEEATERLEAHRFEVRVRTAPSHAAAGTVIDQRPGPGKSTVEGVTVRITVSNGR